MITLMDYMLIAAGGFFGAAARYALSRFFAHRFSSSLPYGTLAVNITGSFLLGFMWGADMHDSSLWLLFGTGFLGAYTTFSSFKLEMVRLFADKQIYMGIIYLILSYACGISMAFVGYGLAP